jgi:tetratricopeptide (TPR) repeat protein
MEWFPWSKNKRGGKMSRRDPLTLILCVTILTAFLYASVAFAQPCGQWVAKAVSVQGAVQALRTGEKQWRSVRLNDIFCPGDMIRIMKLSRADIVLSNDTILRLDQNTTVTFSEPEKEKPFLVNLLNGAAYFFSRVRRSIKVLTPFVNAIVEGTEFYARVENDKTFISLFEGQIGLTNEAGSITLAKGQSAVAEANRAPAFQIVVRPRDAVQWTLYYPPVLDFHPSNLGTPPGWQTMVRKSVEFYMEGNLHQALESLEGVTEEIHDPRFFTYRASLFLSVGRVNEAKLDIEKALSLAALNSQALALQSIIAVVQNEKEKALNLARNATVSDPKSGAARIALSYAQQANFDLKEALNSLKEAVKLEPENALAWARLAEMWLSFGNLSKALNAAKKAVALNPNLSRTQTVLGFAYLTQVKTRKSKEAFEKAIELDQADPLPRLGLGLAKIREGGFPKWESDFRKMVDKGLLEGTRELEIAVSLDPDNSLVRSYLGKAYYEETRDKLATNQFGIAKKLDPSDPTPLFYDAIRKQSINQPGEALRDLQESISLNDNRAVYRSRLLLDSDLAARSASLARIYSDLGFQQLALVEGWKSVNTDPANYSGHRFLADSYSASPRHEIARVSELLQSQLLQPININPVQPHLAESNLFILNGAGPSDLSFNEFNPLFNRNRLALQVSGIAGTHDTFGEEIVQSGVWDRLSYSIGQFHYQTDGFRENNYLKEDIYNVFVQGMLSYKTSVQAEFRATEKRYGDLSLNFFPYDFFPLLRQKDETESMRLGFHHAFSPRSDLIGSFMYQDAEPRLRIYDFLGANFKSKADDDGFSGELQHIFRSERFTIVTGAGHFYIPERQTNYTEDPFLGPSANTTRIHINHTNLYLYSQINYPKNVTFTVGGSGDFYHDGIINNNQFNPKFGVTWNPFSGTTLRAAVFRVFKRTLLTDQTLEPTQVAGFNQFFDDADTTKSWRYGAAIDQKFSMNIYGGLEYSGRKLNDVPFFLETGLGPPQVIKVDWKEQLGRAYLYWTPHPWFGLSAEYQYERFDRESVLLFGAVRVGVAGIRDVKTHRFPLGINFYHPSGFSAQLKATYVNQEGKFQPQFSAGFIPGDDQFCIVDASINYRLPKRYGVLSIGVKNLFNKSFKFQDTDVHQGAVNTALNPTIQPKRLVFGKFTLVF